MKQHFNSSYIFFNIFLLLISFQLIGIAQPKSTTIERILENPSNYEGVEVEFNGLVIQYFVGRGTTNYYIIKGDYGGTIRVNTADPSPETNKKYRVRGIVYRDARNNILFVSEKSKILIETPTQPALPPTTIEPSTTETTFTQTIKDYVIYILIGLLVLLIILFVYFQFFQKSTKQEDFSLYSHQPIPNVQYSGKKEYQPSTPKMVSPEFTSESDFKTIKIVKNIPEYTTLKFIPGKFIISNGADKGKEFKIAGYPTPNGYIVTIGRKEVVGERAYAHIHLNERTVSREQAELLFVNNKLYIKNLSETNYTQVNGVELQPGQSAEVIPGTTIRTGEVEFKYIL